MRKKVPKVGARVLVPIGGFMVEGTVVRVSRTLDPAMITVATKPYEESQEEHWSTYPADDVWPVEAAAA